jgi:hypothetical protein
MTNFKVGDIVRIIKPTLRLKEGSVGKVVHIHMNMPDIGVSWDGFHQGHDCSGNVADNSGYYVFKDCLELAKINNWKERLQ